MSGGKLQGRRALVTGSVQGIGLAIAEELARQGCALVLHGLATDAQAQQARSAVLAAGAPAVEIQKQDLRDAAQVEALMQAVLASPLDILVNNAGIQVTAPLAGMSRSTWDAILAVNLSAAFDTMRMALPAMAQRGYGPTGREAAVRDLLREKQPSLRTSLPGEIGRLVAWLCDPVAHNMTGTAIPVDGGWTAQ